VDLAIRFGKGDWPGLEALKFMDDELFPVASPGFNRGRLPRRPAELAKLRLMRSDDEFWTPWFQAAALLLQAAADGQGIALARRSIAEDDLRAKRLVRLFDIAAPAQGANYLVWPKGRLAANAALLRDWLLKERDLAHP